MPVFSAEALDDVAGLDLLRDVLGSDAPAFAPTLATRFSVKSAPAADPDQSERSVKRTRSRPARKLSPLGVAAAG